MRYHDDPRWDVSRTGQVEYNTGASSTWNPGVVRQHKHEFRPYRWRDPAHARAWAQLPADLIELMQTEAADEDEPPLEVPKTPAARPPGVRAAGWTRSHGTARPGPA